MNTPFSGHLAWLGIRLLVLLLPIALLTLCATTRPVGAATFNPEWSATLANSSPGANSNITFQLDIPAPDANFGGLVSFIPPGSVVAGDEAVPDGAVAGSVVADARIGLINGACNSVVPATIELLEATTDDSQIVPLYYGVEDFDGDGLVENVTQYPDVLAFLAPGIQPVQRLYGQTIVAGIFVPLNFVVFEPGTPLPLLPALDPSLGYPTVTILGNPYELVGPIPITDFCTPLVSTTTIRGKTADNAATAADESGHPLRANPSEAGAFNATIFARSLWDRDDDGIENNLDPCPFTPDPGWDPRSSANQASDADQDGLPSSCDPNDNLTNSDQDGDGFLNRQDFCPLVVDGFYLEDTDADDIGDLCDPHPDDPSDGGQSHRHEVCIADTILIGSPASTEPPPLVCPSGPDLPIPPVLEAGPREGRRAAGGVHSVYAYAQRPARQGPAPGVTVTFDISGAHTLTGDCLTDNSGYCTFNYQGTVVGADTIQVSAVIDGIPVSRTITNEWLGPPPHDAFADAMVIEAIPFEDVPELIAATRESGEPNPCGGTSRTAWYAFTATESGTLVAEVETNSSPIVVAVFTGSSLASLQTLGCDDGYFGPPPFVRANGVPPPPDGFYFESYVTFQAEAGETYYIQVGRPGEDFYGGEGEIFFSLEEGVRGDTNCDGALSAIDALNVLRAAARIPPPSACNAAGDVDCDGDLDSVDALRILRQVAGLANLPACA